MRSLCLVLSAAVFAAACAADTSATATGLTVVAGAWSYSVTESIPLPAGPAGGHCTATASGTVQVSANGGYSITFPVLSCSGCSMTASTSGTITSDRASGTVTASIAGSGCSNQQPTPSPSSASGACTSTHCNVSVPDGESYSVAYTLTPP